MTQLLCLGYVSTRLNKAASVFRILSEINSIFTKLNNFVQLGHKELLNKCSISPVFSLQLLRFATFSELAWGRQWTPGDLSKTFLVSQGLISRSPSTNPSLLQTSSNLMISTRERLFWYSFNVVYFLKSVMILKMILKSFDFQCDFDFQIATSKMILMSKFIL